MRARLEARRKAHLNELDGLALFSGVPREPGSENIWVMNGLRIFQEPALIHLTGINQPGIILALDPVGTEKVILFLPPKDSTKEFWDGVRLGYPLSPEANQADLEEVTALTGIEDLRPVQEFEAWFQKRIKSRSTDYCYAFYHQYADPKGGPDLISSQDHNFAFKTRLETLATAVHKKIIVKTCVNLHFKLRLPLEPEQVKDALYANEITGEAFAETLKQVKRFKNENEAAAYLEWGMRKRSEFGLSFPSIVASGRNATILHYLKNDAPIDSKGMLLMDFGARWGTMHADITRTIPVTGRFNPLQALLYEIVLEAQISHEKAVKPGATIRSLNDAVWLRLETLLDARFLSKGGKMQRAYTQKPHGVSHLMGEQEHDGDPHRLYQDLPLQVGWQLSNEPGLYGHFSISIRGKRYQEWVGIRIEDDLLVTAKGCKNLSAMVPKDIPTLQKMMS